MLRENLISRMKIHPGYLRFLAAGLGVALIVAICPKFSDGANTSLINLKSIEQFPVLESGRVKPLDTFARNVLLQLSGRSSYQGKPALEWLCGLFWNPKETAVDKVFLINNPEIPLALGVVPDPHRRYSFSQMEKGFHKLIELAEAASRMEDKDRSVVDKELMRVYGNIVLYLQLSHSFEFAMPSAEFSINEPSVLGKLQFPQGQREFSFLDIALKAEQLEKIASSLQKKDSKTWTAAEQDMFRLLTNLYQWANFYQDLPLKIIAPLSPREKSWISPWDAIGAGFHDPAVRKEISALRDLTEGYLNVNQETFDRAAAEFAALTYYRGKNFRELKFMGLEIFYNKLQPFFWAKILYFFVICLVAAFLLNPQRRLYEAAYLLLGLGGILHLAGIAIRIIIMNRPPVTSLYETFLFVGGISLIAGFIMESFQRRGLGILTAGLCGFILLTIAGKFASDGDTMNMLVAVLNSNFWLSTHVLTITMGYAGCCVAGVLGHVYLIQSLRPRAKGEGRAMTYRFILGSLAFGLALSFLGTTLGGIWADQSWGRFWGWDPKENGALMIVLWCAIIFHSKIARMIDEIGVAVASVFGLLVVLWAWFGVNLLSVGLHSYGFTSGVATNLFIYAFTEILFVFACLGWFHYKKIK